MLLLPASGVWLDYNTMWAYAWACRVFVAQREGYNNTWINTYAPFVDLYAADDTECTSQEVSLCCELFRHNAQLPCLVMYHMVAAVMPVWCHVQL